VVVENIGPMGRGMMEALKIRQLGEVMDIFIIFTMMTETE